MGKRAMSAEPTPKQLDCLVWLAGEYGWLNREDFPPTVEDVAAGLRCCKSYAHQLLQALEQHGLIARVRKKARTLGATQKGKRLAAEWEKTRAELPETDNAKDLPEDQQQAASP